MTEKPSDLQPTHYAFSDESNWNGGRFRSITIVTTTAEHFPTLNNDLTQILNNQNFAKEFKWSELTEGRKVAAANELLKFAFDKASLGHLKIATIIWDTDTEWYKAAKIENKKNSVLLKQRLANRKIIPVTDFDELTLNQMYFYIYYSVLTQSWSDKSVWHFYPDEQNVLVWEALHQFLDSRNTTLKSKKLPVPTIEGRNYEFLKHRFDVQQITPAKSDQTPFIQLADLFAGMGAFALNQAEHYQDPYKNNQLQLPLVFDNTLPPSKSSRQRFKLLSNFFQLSSHHRFYIDLFHLRELPNHRPFHPISFWLYKPKDQVPPESPRKGTGFYYLVRPPNNNTKSSST